MLTAGEVIKEARFALSDETGQRWSDDRLLSLLNDAIKDVALKTNLFNRRLYLKILSNVVEYDISSVALRIRRVEFDQRRIHFRSYEEMDNYGKNSNNTRYYNSSHSSAIYTNCSNHYSNEGGNDWKKHQGSEPTLIIYDKQDFGKFRSYPLVENTNFDHIESNQIFGLVTGIFYEDIQIVPQGVLGDLDPPDLKQYFHIYYIARHAKITDAQDELDINEMYKEMLSYYITGRALIDNIDAMNREMSRDYFSLYQDRIDEVNENNESNFVESKPTSTYRSME